MTAPVFHNSCGISAPSSAGKHCTVAINAIFYCTTATLLVQHCSRSLPEPPGMAFAFIYILNQSASGVHMRLNVHFNNSSVFHYR